MPMKPLNVFQKADLERARQADKALGRLSEEVSDLLGPIASTAMDAVAEFDINDLEELGRLDELINSFPPGFYRSELRTMMNNRLYKRDKARR